MGWSPQNNLQPAATDMLYFGSEIRLGFSVVKVLSRVLLAWAPHLPSCQCHGSSSDLPCSQGEVWKSSATPTTIRNCLNHVVLIENDKATPMAMNDQLSVNHSETNPEKSICELSSWKRHRAVQYPSELLQRIGDRSGCLMEAFLRFWVAWWQLWVDRTSCLTLVSSSAGGPEGARVSWLGASAWLPPQV